MLVIRLSYITFTDKFIVVSFMGKNQVCITFTKKEIAHCHSRAELRKTTVWRLLQKDINKIFSGIGIPDGDCICVGDKERTTLTLDIPLRTWKIIVCLSGKLGMSPTQLVYRVIVAPYLVEIIAQEKLVAGVHTAD